MCHEFVVNDGKKIWLSQALLRDTRTHDVTKPRAYKASRFLLIKYPPVPQLDNDYKKGLYGPISLKCHFNP